MVFGRITATLRLTAWGCVVLLAVLSLLPAQDMARTGVGDHIEHAVAYAGTALLMGIGYRGCRAVRIIILLVAYAGVLELLQHISPGRQPGLDDWAASSAGVLMGSLAAHWALAIFSV